MRKVHFHTFLSWKRWNRGFCTLLQPETMIIFFPTRNYFPCSLIYSSNKSLSVSQAPDICSAVLRLATTKQSPLNIKEREINLWEKNTVVKSICASHSWAAGDTVSVHGGGGRCSGSWQQQQLKLKLKLKLKQQQRAHPEDGSECSRRGEALRDSAPHTLH